MLTKVDTGATVTVPTELSGPTTDQFLGQMTEAVTTRPELVALDCSHLEHVTSKHVSHLWQAYQMCAEADVRLVLHGASSNLFRLLELLDLAEFFPRDTVAMRRIHRDSFPATQEGINEALERFLQYVHLLGLPAMTEFEMRTLFYEVATNVRSHASLEPSQQVSVEARVENNQLVMTFIDHGHPFDPTAVTSNQDLRQAAQRHQRRGFGLTMIRRLADKVGYRRLDDGANELTVVKHWSE